MSWTARISGHNYGEIQTFDCGKAPADLIASRVANNSTGPQDLAAVLVELSSGRGPVTPAYVQGVMSGSAATYNATTFTITLPADVKAHSCLVLDILLQTTSNNFSISVDGGTSVLHPPHWPLAWQPVTAYGIGDEIVDLFGSVQQVTLVNGLPTGTGISGSGRPTWNQTLSGNSTDGAGATSITWTNMGPSGQQVGQLLPGSGTYSFCITCHDCEAGPASITITATAGTGGHLIGDITCALHEYSGVELSAPIVAQSQAGLVGSTTGHVDLSITTSSTRNAFHLAAMVRAYIAPSSLTVNGGGIPLAPLEAWLVIYEPGIGYVDQTERMFYGDGQQNSFSQQLRQRGTATVQLRIDGDDTYAPTQFTPLYLYDYTDADGYVLVFAGIIQDVEYQWLGTGGTRYALLQVASLESVLDTVYASPVQFFEQLAGDIVTSLFNTFLGDDCPVQLGTISDGALIPLLNTNWEKISELLDQLAVTSGLTWWVDPSTQLLNFTDPALVPAPIVLEDANVLWESFSHKAIGSDYRNRQAVRADLDAFPQSGEFIVGAGQTSITLSRPVQQVTNAYATLSTCNTATGTFTGQPAAGDTITIGPPSGAWQSLHLYALAGVIVVNGYVQKVTTNGTSGAVQPTFATITGNPTTDGSVIWTCQGPLGLGTGQMVYTFRTAIDNTEFGEVLIGATYQATAQNFVDAVNATITRAGVQLRGSTYSLPTWENGQINAISLVGGVFTAQTKSAGTGWVSELLESCSNFAWSTRYTAGGTSPQGSLGPGYGATISLQVYTAGTSTAAPGLSYIPGSATITMATPLNAGSNLNIYYTRADGGVIEVEDTAQVAAMAALTGGTGKYQQITDASQRGMISNSSAAALQMAQESLAAYSSIPEAFDFRTFYTGFYVGQELEVLMTLPTGALTRLNGTWIVMGIDAELVPCYPTLGPYGHYEYTLHLVNIEESGSYMDFWAGLGGGGSGGGSGGSGLLVATSGGAQTSTPSSLQLQTNGVTNGSQVLLNLAGGTNVTIADGGSGTVTISSSGAVTAGATGTVYKSIAGGTVAFQRETYSVLSYGATGNGVTDDTATCAAAITAAASGGNVVFPPGVYIVSGLTLAQPNITITIMAGATLKLKASSNAPVITITANYCRVVGEGIIDGNKTNQTTNPNCFGVLFNASAAAQALVGVQIAGITVQNTRNAGIMGQQTGAGSSTKKCTIEAVTVLSCGAAAVSAIAEGIALYGPSQCTVTGCLIDGTANHNIVSTRGSDNTFTNNRCLNAGSLFNNGFAHAIAVDGDSGLNRCSGHIADSNYCENARDHSIEFADGTDRCTISNNIVNGTSSHGVGGIYFGGALAYSEYVSITGNQVYSVIGAGVIVEGPSSGSRSAHATVAGNVVYGCSEHGIYIHNADEGTVTANVVMNSSIGHSGTYSGITLSTFDRWTVTANRSGDNQGSPTQKYGISVVTTPSNAAVITDNNLLPAQSAAINYASGTSNLTVQNNPSVTNVPAAGSGSVTSVAMTVPTEFSVAGSPITSSGTLAVTTATQSANLVWAGPTTGAAATPAFRALVAADIPAGGGSPLTTKGDIYTYAAAAARLAVGSDGQVLTARSSATNGIAWEAASGGSTTHSESLTDGNSNFIFAGGDIVTVIGVAN